MSVCLPIKLEVIHGKMILLTKTLKMWHRKRGKKKHFTILDSVAVSNLFLAFLPSMEGFLPLLFWKVCVLLHSSFGHTNKNIFFCACQNPSSQHRQNYWISAVILILFRMPKPQIKRTETKKSSRGRDTRWELRHQQVFPGGWWGYLCAVYSHKDRGASITGGVGGLKVRAERYRREMVWGSFLEPREVILSECGSNLLFSLTRVSCE